MKTTWWLAEKKFSDRLASLPGVTALPSLAMPAAAFALVSLGPLLETPQRQALEYRLISRPLALGLEPLSLAASALEDVRYRSTPVNSPRPIVQDSLEAGELEFDKRKVETRGAPAALFAVPLVTVAEYLTELEGYEPRDIIPRPVQKDSRPSGPVTPVQVAAGTSAPVVVAASSQVLPTYRTASPTSPAQVTATVAGMWKDSGVQDLARLMDIRQPRNKEWISGRVELSQGLAFLAGGQSLKVVRFENGRMTGDRAVVRWETGEFRMQVRNAGGTVRAFLMDELGEVVGQGEQSIGGSDPLTITIEPLFQGLQIRVLSAHSLGGHSVPVANAQVELLGTAHRWSSQDDGRVLAAEVGTGSTAQLRISHDGFWPTLTFARTAGFDQSMLLFPDSFIEALSGLSNVTISKQAGIVWGQVSLEGESRDRVQVEITSEQSHQPFYFSEFAGALMPNSQLKMTEKNGYFAFVNVPDGIHTLRLRRPDSGLESTMLIEVVAGHVHLVDARMRTETELPFRLVDLLNLNREVEGRVAWISDPSADLVRKGQPAQIASDLGLSFQALDIDPGVGYAPIRQTPVVTAEGYWAATPQLEWLEKAWSALGSRPAAGRGIVVGMVGGDLEAVELENSEWAGELVYFDSQGNFRRKPTGVRDGGFVLLNVPEGFQSVQIQSVRRGRISIKTVFVEAGRASVVAHQSR